MSGGRRIGAPVLVVVLVLAGAAATVLLRDLPSVGIAAFLDGNQASTWVAGLTYGLLGAAVLSYRDHGVLGVVFSAIGLLATAAATAAAYAVSASSAAGLPTDLAALAGGTLWLPALLLVWCAVPLVYPTGRLAPGRWRAAASVAATAGAVAVVSLATTPSAVAEAGPTARPLLDAGWLPPESVRVAVAAAGVAVTAAVGLAAVAAIAVGLRHSPSPRRQQEAWYLVAVLLVLVATVTSPPAAVDLAMDAVVAVALGVGVLRHRVVDVEMLLPRVLVLLAFTAVVCGVYLLAATALGVSLAGGLWPVVVAALSALLLATGQQRAQRVVERWVLGARRDPLGAVNALGDRLGGALSAEASLPVVVEQVRESMKVPYAALVRVDGRTAVEVGRPSPRTASARLRFAEEDLGTLVVGLRAGERSLATPDARLLEAFARPMSVAVHGARVEASLRRSRERLVVAREEERRRIRRELHDGLGPALAGIALGLERAASSTADAATGRPLLDELRAETSSCVDEVRRIVADLRPVLLDEVGLSGALSRQASRLSRDAMRVEFALCSDTGARLPAAVEAAAYRIGLEAMTNAVRHSAGSSCAVELDVGDELVRLRVRDDGTGVPGTREGNGLTFMHERAEELGGRCEVRFGAGSGTTVEVALPARVAP